MSKRVLIVDDALELGRLLQAAIATLKADLHVTVVPSAEEAQLEAARVMPELIITDVRLPGISGLELTRRIRSHDKQVRIVLITALLDPTMRQQAIEAGADYFFKKPISMPDFLNAVVKLLGVPSVPPPSTPSPALPSTWNQAPPPQPGLEKSQADRIVDGLASLRRTLAASTVALMDEQIHLLVQDGEPADRTLDPTLLQALSSAMAAGEKVSHALGNKTQETAYAFKGRSFDVVAAPLGGAFAILVVLKGGRTSVRLSIAVDEILAARRELERVLAEMGITLRPLQPKHITGPLNPDRVAQSAQTPQPSSYQKLPSRPAGTIMLDLEPQAASAPASTPAPAPAADTSLESLFKDKSKLKESDVDAFWEAALKDEDQSLAGQEDRITFEQARRLGLAPDQNPPSDSK